RRGRIEIVAAVQGFPQLASGQLSELRRAFHLDPAHHQLRLPPGFSLMLSQPVDNAAKSGMGRRDFERLNKASDPARGDLTEEIRQESAQAPALRVGGMDGRNTDGEQRLFMAVETAFRQIAVVRQVKVVKPRGGEVNALVMSLAQMPGDSAPPIAIDAIAHLHNYALRRLGAEHPGEVVATALNDW